ncbi:MAG TPA: hypothetical protein ENH94_04740 [Phycisphaerales bacterium]|nr:hypothetical protein [Phycisphaerales bacterium]
MKYLKGSLIMEKTNQTKAYSHKAQFAPNLSKQQIVQDDNAGFLFCPRCGSVVVGQNVNSICRHCGYRFCPSCSD